MNIYVTFSLSLSLSLFHSHTHTHTHRFPNMGILHVTKKKVPEVLTRRLLQQLKMRDTAGLDQLDMEGQQNLSEGTAPIHTYTSTYTLLVCV